MIQWREKIQKKTFWGQILAIFFGIMILCTFISKAADSVIVPKVQTESPVSGSLKYKFQGTGSIKASEGELVTVPQSLRVKEITKPGTNVEAGDALAVMDTDELVRVLEEENAKLEQLRLQLEREQLNAAPDAVTPQTLSAGKNLEQAQKQYHEAAAKLDEAVDEEKNDAVLRQQKAEEKKQEAYDTFLNEGGESNEEAKSVYDQTVSAIEQELVQDSAEKQAQIDALVQNRDAMQDAYEQAKAAYEMAQIEDENAKTNQKKAEHGSDITQQGLQIDIEQQQKVTDRLKEIIDSQGILKSPVKGTVTVNTLSEGMVTSGQEYIRIGTGGYQFQAPTDKENASKLKTGDYIEIEFAGKKGVERLKITDIRSETDKSGALGGSGSTEGRNEASGNEKTSGDQNPIMYIVAELEGDDYADGMEGNYVIKKESDIRYDWILPIGAIREDQNGTYCLITRKKNTILGEEDVTERLDLVKKAKDANQIAVEGAFTNDTKVIIESSKEINEGDRVRIEDEE